MVEPRMRPRPKGQQFLTDDLSAMLQAYGDDHAPLPSTIQSLDNIITDFIIETCHEAAARATYAGRAKVKQDDFQWALRRDARKLGRVQELLFLQNDLEKKRKTFDVDDEEARRQASGEGPEKPGRGRGRKKKKVEDKTGDEHAAEAGTADERKLGSTDDPAGNVGVDDDMVDD